MNQRSFVKQTKKIFSKFVGSVSCTPECKVWNGSKKKVKKTDENDIPSPSYQELLSNNSKKKRNAKNNTKKTRKMVSSRNSNGSNSGRNSNGRSSKLRAPSTKSGIPQRTNSSSSILSDKSNH